MGNKNNDLSAEDLIKRLMANLNNTEENPGEKEEDSEQIKIEEIKSAEQPKQEPKVSGTLYHFKVKSVRASLPEATEDEPDFEASALDSEISSEIADSDDIKQSIQNAELYVNDLAERVATGEIEKVKAASDPDEYSGDDPDEEGENEDAPNESLNMDATNKISTTENKEENKDNFGELSQLAKKAIEDKNEVEDADGPEELIPPAVENLDEKDVNLMMIFNMEDELEEKLGAEKVRKLRREMEDRRDLGESEFIKEYESSDQNKEFSESYQKKFLNNSIRLLMSFVLFGLIAVFECIDIFHGTLPRVLDGRFYPEIHMLAALQLTLLCVAVAYKEVLYGFKAIKLGKAEPDTILSVLTLFSVIYEISILISNPANGSNSIQMYNMPLAFGSIMAILCSRMNLKREMWAFKIISTRNNKYVIGHLKASDSKLEKNAFDSYIDESSDMLTVGRTEFVSDYASRSVRPPKNKTAIGMLIPLVVLVAIVFLVVEYYRTSDIIAALTAAQLTLMMGLPLSAFFTFSFPFYKASKSAFGLGSAIIGESSLEEYSSASVISFSDKDVFPAQGVKVRSMKLYGNSRIDHILYKTASVFGALGGPLSDVFMVATKDLGHSGDVDIVEITANGVEAAVDGEHVFVGSADYIRENGYVPTIDAEDREVEYHGHVSIMYVAIAGELSAKMYIEYKMDPEIEDIIKSLCKSGMCLGIRTFDPNIDDSMLDRRIKLSKYPVRVLKCSQGTEMSKIEKRTDSGIVSKRSAKNLLKTLTYCDKVLQIIKTNIAVKIFSIIASIIAVGLIIFFGGIDKTNSLYVLLFQIFWMIPMAVIAALFV